MRSACPRTNAALLTLTGGLCVDNRRNRFRSWCLKAVEDRRSRHSRSTCCLRRRTRIAATPQQTAGMSVAAADADVLPSNASRILCARRVARVDWRAAARLRRQSDEPERCAGIGRHQRDGVGRRDRTHDRCDVSARNRRRRGAGADRVRQFSRRASGPGYVYRTDGRLYPRGVHGDRLSKSGIRVPVPRI